MAGPSALDRALETYEPVIGLEVHAQLLTTSKLFSGAPAAFAPNQPNTHIDAYSIALPGTLPVLNERAVTMAVRAGLALGCTIQTSSTFSRKHYFYPDLPKGYQISQYDLPLASHGRLEIHADDGSPRVVRILRLHMEEDAGKNVHVEGAPYTLVDFNRAGVPLVEIVSEPDIRSAKEAAEYLKALRAILMTLEVSDGNMQEGSLRADVNISLRPRGSSELKTRVEIKNLNSFRFVEHAIEAEIVRQARQYDDKGGVEQETRSFDSKRRETRPLRTKEEAHDYRYFPDPDLPPLMLSAEWIAAQAALLPELPQAKRSRFLALGLSDEVARTLLLEREITRFFEAAIARSPALVIPIANVIKGDILRELKDAPEGIATSPLSPNELVQIVELRAAQKISSTQQSAIVAERLRGVRPLEAILADSGEQVSDEGTLLPIVRAVLAEHPREVERLLAGKTQLMSFFVGQVMKQTQGKANPELVRSLVATELSAKSQTGEK